MPDSQHALVSRSRSAAALYLLGELTLKECGERFGISITAVHNTVVKQRAAQRVWPEDEVTL